MAHPAIEVVAQAITDQSLTKAETYLVLAPLIGGGGVMLAVAAVTTWLTYRHANQHQEAIHRGAVRLDTVPAPELAEPKREPTRERTRASR